MRPELIRSGVRGYWLVDPELESVEVFSLGPRGFRPPARYDRAGRLASEVVPDFEATLAEVFTAT